MDDYSHKLTPEERREWWDRLIEKYNRAHGQNPKITLKDICEREGVSYQAVKTHRLRKRKAKK